MPEILPRFQIEKIDEPFVKTVIRSHKNEKGEHEKFEREEVEYEGGYMAYFPQGHSIHVRDDKTLAQLGLDGDPTLVDMESGENVPGGVSNLKNRVAAKTHNVRK